MPRNGPPVLQRSPRLHPELPKGDVEIQSPPAPPSLPSLSFASVLLGLLPGVMGAVIMFFMARSMGSNSLYSVGYSLPMLLIGSVVQVFNLSFQKRRYRHDTHLRERSYRELLQTHQETLERARELQQTTLLKKDSAPAEYLTRAEQCSPRLWERSVQDADFLSVRLGLGTLPFVMTVKPPREQNLTAPDPLYREAQAVAAKFAHVAGVPVTMPLLECGVAGVAGPRTAVLNTARNLVLQLAGNHSPDEVKIVAVFPQEEAEEWEWMRWLPHTWSDDRRSRFLACDRDGAHQLLGALYDSLNRRKLQMAMQKESVKGPLLPMMLFFLADPRLIENEAIMGLLLREGPSIGAFPVVLAARKEELPKECQGIAVVSSAAGQLMLTKPTLTQAPFLPDQAPVDLADRIARAMAPVRLTTVAASGEIPAKVTLMELLGAGRVEDLDVRERWRKSEPFKSLAVPIGVRGGGEKLVLDIHERGHGPHGLGAGATGSGKSELLQTVIASLAVSFHPHDVAFVMVDYKGGGMANQFEGLPHLIGTVTNLEGNMAKRALAALKAELKRRQRLLGEAGVNHIDDYIRMSRKDPTLTALPHLVIVVDEFAELKAEQPEFMRELISAVRVGRSLGVHLILATQKPAGVVDEQIWSNTKFRLCLRVERPQDSQEVLKCPDAANITGSGRGYFQVGNNEIFELFQAAWGGAPYQPGAETVSVGPEVAEVGLGGERRSLIAKPKTASGQTKVTQLQALVNHLRDVAQQAQIKPLDGPWMPPLSDHLVLERPGQEGWDGQTWRPAGTWLEPVAGLVDDPERQRQYPLTVNLGKDGHLAVYGGPGMGKTTFLQTLVTSLAYNHSPEELHMYLVDCSGRTLQLLRGLPHVGEVVLGEETERMTRLFRMLLQELETRKQLLSDAGVSTFAAYRQVAATKPPALLVVFDNYPVLTNVFPEGDEVVQLAREGGALGVHLVVTANSPSLLRTRVSSNIAGAVSLALTDRTDYPQAVGRTNGLEPMAIPGRGLVKSTPPLEFQALLPVEGETEWTRSAALKELFRTMDQAWTGARPRPVKVLRDLVPLAEIVSPAGQWPAVEMTLPVAAPIGVEVGDLEPFAINLQTDGPHFVVTGPPESGKTTLLQTWVLALAERLPPERIQLWLVDGPMGGLAPLKGLPQVSAYVSAVSELEPVLGRLADQIQERKEQARGNGAGERAMLPSMVLVIDDFDAVVDEGDIMVKDRLEQWIRRERGVGLHVIAAGSSGGFQGYDPLVKALKELQTGVLLGSTDHGDLGLFNLRLPSGEAGKMLPAGLGYFVRRGRFRQIKVASPHAGSMGLADWVELIAKRCEPSR